MIRLDRRLLPMTLGALALLHAWPVSAQFAASGTTLSVTSANAVATFHGADLVGFVNSLTNEQYLKKPTTDTFANVDVMTPTGQALQVSNWTIGTESGSGLPLATATLSDSVRSMTITVKVDPASQEIVLRVSATVSTGGARGASWSIAGLDLAGGRSIVPANSGAVFDANNFGVNAFIKYPTSWQAQMAVYQAAAGSLLLYSTDSQYLFKSLRQTSRGDTTLDVSVYTEATAPWPSATAVPAVEWRMKAFAGDWRVAAAPYRDWMLANRPPVSNAAHPWVSNIRNVVAVGALDSTILAPLAAQLTPAQTLLYLVNWRQSNYDVNYPDYTPAASAAAFITAAHALGFKVMLHTDILGVAPTNADYAGVQQYQTRTPDTLQLMGWNWDQTTVPDRYGLIDPAASAYRALWIARIGVAINLLNPDALHLDFTAMYNDGNGPIEGRTFPQGEDYFNQQIVTAFPNIALGSEEEFDFTYRYHSFAQMGFWAFQSAGHPISNFLFSPQVQFYGHLATPLVTDPAFKTAFMRQMQIGAFPLWWIYAPSFIDTTNPDIARFTQIAKAWQNNVFQPAWTDDWMGALIRYQGLNGASAALTDRGGLLSLGSSQSTLFTLAHDVNQVSTDGFIDHWAAFDNSTLYGLDPAVLYFVDTEPRPDSTHATSLPPGTRLGPGTLVTPSFAHLELAPPAAFDFTNLSNARVGITYQGVDYPLGFGAVVQTQTHTVGGVSRSDISIQPPWQGQIGAETFAEYAVVVPAGAALQLSVGIDDGAACTDGVTFRVTAGGAELWHQDLNRGAWHDIVLSLAAYAGSTVPIRLISNPGPAANPSCDRTGWSEVALVAPTPAISVPIRLASTSIFSGIDGASYTPVSGSTGTVTNAAVPGAFTIFTQPGSAVVSGTKLATLPFDVWHWDKDGSPPAPGTVFNGGAVQSETSGGVTKNPAIWAHPPNASRTVLSWVLRLPASPLQLGWNAGLIDGATSDDGVTFEVRVNGLPYWTLTTGVQGDDHWTAGQLDLSRWQGQSILLELITDSRSNNSFDWAAWADLVLTTSAGPCAYSVPSSASVGATGGTFTATITTSAPCSWSAVPNVPWITLIAGSGAGNGTVTFDVGLNAGGTRSGTMTIAGNTLTIMQAASTTTPPSITLQPLSQIVAPSQPFSLRVVAIGTAPLIYQWYLGASGDTSHPLPSAGSTYSSTASATCCFWVRVSNSGGHADSATAAITVGTGATTTPGPGGGTNFGGSPGGDAFLYKPSTGAWSMQLSSAGTFIGLNSGAWAGNWTIQAGDFNGDGLTDLFLYNPATGQWFKVLNRGGGDVSYFGGTWAPNWTVTLLDFDGDGKTDMFLYNQTTGHWFRAMSVGDGDFSYFSGVWAPGWSLYPAEFNGDGRADLFLYNRNATSDANHGLWFRVITEADGSFGYLPGDVRWGNTWTVTPADLNGDGLTDLFLYNATNGQYFRVVFVNGVATYDGGAWGPNWTIAQGDFNGDGRADLFLYNTSNGIWFVVITNPDGTLTYFNGQWAGNWAVTVTDFDADGRSDILLYNATTGQWFQALTVSPGTFSFTTDNWGTGWTVIAGRTIVP